MIIAIDIGNSNIVFGVFVEGELNQKWLLLTNRDYNADQYASFFIPLLVTHYYGEKSISEILKSVEAVIISSVVPQANTQIKIFIEKYLSITPIFVNYNIHNLRILLPNPRELGSDFIVNGTAALHLYQQDCIVVDFGTATTFSAVQKDGNTFLGAVIAPGIKTSLNGLVRSASQLRDVEIIRPARGILHTNTVGSMQSGIYYGFVSMAEGIINRLQEELNLNAKTILTGGFSNIIDINDSSSFDVIEPNLTLLGLYQLYLTRRI